MKLRGRTLINLLLVGSRYLPYRHEGEKNFWFELVEILKQNIENIHVLSINRDHKGVFQKDNVKIYNVSPFLFPTINSRYNNLSLGFSNNYISRSFTLLNILRKIHGIVEENNIQVVHFIDNYGPTMLGINKTLRIPLSIVAPTYHPRYYFYDHFLKQSIAPFDKIITTSHAFKEKLRQLGVIEDKLEVIHLGVNLSKYIIDTREKNRIKKSLGIRPDLKIILWSGFLQQIGVEEFRYSLKIARETLKKTQNILFIFAFKHVHFKEKYHNYATERMKVMTTESNRDFIELVKASNAFLSPVLSKNSIVAPPLTWIECMARRVPIITTNIGGVSELVKDQITGYTFNTIEEASQKIAEMIIDDESQEGISKKASTLIHKEYDIKNIVNKYLNMWYNLIFH